MDRLLAKSIVEQMILSCERIERRFSTIHSCDDFLDSEEGLEKIDSIYMQIVAIGESAKNLDKVTNTTLLLNYPQTPWNK